MGTSSKKIHPTRPNLLNQKQAKIKGKPWARRKQKAEPGHQVLRGQVNRSKSPKHLSKTSNWPKEAVEKSKRLPAQEKKAETKASAKGRKKINLKPGDHGVRRIKIGNAGAKKKRGRMYVAP